MLFEGVTVEEGADVSYSIVMPGSVIKKGATVQYAIIAENVTVEEGAVIGERPELVGDKERWGIAVVGNDRRVGKNAKISAKAIIYNDVKDGETV